MIYLLIILTFAIDRLSKWWAADYLADVGVAEIHPLLILQPVYNRGIAFGMLQGIGPIIGWISIAVLVGLLLYLRRVPKDMWILRVGLALIIGGALGNLVDRITIGEVLDFIMTPLRPGIFNLADVMIYLGVLLSILSLFLQGQKAEPPPAKTVEQDPTSATDA